MRSSAVGGNWSADIKSFTVLEISFWSVERVGFFELLIVCGVVKLSICLFDVEVSVPHSNSTSFVSWFDDDIISLLKIS